MRYSTCPNTIIQLVSAVSLTLIIADTFSTTRCKSGSNFAFIMLLVHLHFNMLPLHNWQNTPNLALCLYYCSEPSEAYIHPYTIQHIQNIRYVIVMWYSIDHAQVTSCY